MAIAFYDGVLNAADAGWIRPPGSENTTCDDFPGRWIDRGQVASGVGATGFQIDFADINGDRRDDYLWLHPNGAVDAWINIGGDSGSTPGWHDQGLRAVSLGEPKCRMWDLGSPSEANLAILDYFRRSWTSRRRNVSLEASRTTSRSGSVRSAAHWQSLEVTNDHTSRN